MNPQLEHHLLEFEGPPDDYEPSIGQGGAEILRKDEDLHGKELRQTEKECFPETAKDFQNSLLFFGVLFLGIFLLAAAERNQVFAFRLELSFGGKNTMVLPGSALGVLTLAFLFNRQDLIPFSSKEQSNDMVNNDNNIAIMATRRDSASAQQRLQCRLELSKFLGKVGAPLLQEKDNGARIPSDQETRNITKQNECGPSFQTTMSNSVYIAQLIEFAKAHAELLQILGIAIESIKGGTAFQLGASHTMAERVERAIHGRLALQSSDSGSNSLADIPVSFRRTRALVSQIMLEQVVSLESILEHVVSARDQKDNKENTDEEEFVGQEPNNGTQALSLFDEIPQVISLGWLRSYREQIVDLLHEALDLLSAENSLLPAEAPIDERGLDELIQSSIHRAKEMRQHLLSSLQWETLDQTKIPQRSTNQVKKSGQVTNWATLGNDLTPCLLKTRQNLHSLYMALWAMEDAAKQDGVNNSAIDGKTLEDWWSRVSDLSEACNTSLCHIQERFVNTDDQCDDDGNGNGSNLNQSPTKVPNGKVVSELVDEPSQIEQPNYLKPTTSRSSKTAVFSGKGALAAPTSKSKKKERMENSSNISALSASVVNPNPMAQHMVLGELQKRLKALSLPEEEHGTEDITEEEENDTRRREKTTSVPSFGSMQGSILVGELKKTISEFGSSSIGDNDDVDVDYAIK